MHTPKTSFQTVLDALLDSKKDFPRGYLIQFSDIGTLELKTLQDVWSRVGLSRKLTLLEGLASLADEDTLVNFDDFARSLLNDPDAAVRIHALRLVSESEDTKLIPQILTMLKKDADVNVRVASALTLGMFVAQGELEKISESAYSEVKAGLLESARGEDETRVRRQALESLGYTSNEDVVKLIESALKKDSDWQASALIAAGRSADGRWEDDILRSLVDEDERIRIAAVQAAGMLSLKSARTILLNMLAEIEEEDEEIANAAIWSLSQIGGEDVRTFLEALLDQTEDEDAIEILEEALDNLSFTEDLDRFELMAFDPAGLDDFDEDEDEDEDK